MQERSNNPLDVNDFSQEERDRVLQKYQTVINLYGGGKAKEHLTPEEMVILMNTMANKAIEKYDEKLAQTAIWKIAKATGGKMPTSSAEMARLSEKMLNTDEKAALIGYFAQKTRNPNGSFGVRENKK